MFLTDKYIADNVSVLEQRIFDLRRASDIAGPVSTHDSEIGKSFIEDGDIWRIEEVIRDSSSLYTALSNYCSAAYDKEEEISLRYALRLKAALKELDRYFTKYKYYVDLLAEWNVSPEAVARLKK